MKPRMKWIFLTLFAGCFLFPVNVFADTTYRWRSDSLEWIYSPTPPDDADQPFDVLKDGIVIQHFDGAERNHAPKVEVAQARMTPEEKQRQYDALLVLQFKSLDDIDEAMNVELGHLGYEFGLNETTANSLRNSLYAQIESAANRQRAGLEVEQHEMDQLTSIRDRLAGVKIEHQRLIEREATIRQAYSERRSRYAWLLDQSDS